MPLHASHPPSAGAYSVQEACHTQSLLLINQAHGMTSKKTRSALDGSELNSTFFQLSHRDDTQLIFSLSAVFIWHKTNLARW